MLINPRSILSAILLAVIAATISPAYSQDSPPPTSSDDSKVDETNVREQSIYIPYEKLEGVFEKHGRGVFLPYEKFQELWKAARANKVKPAEPKPPVRSLITEIENEAAVEGEVVKVRSKLQIEVLAEGWTEVPLRLGDAAITSAKLDGKPARIVGDARQGYKLLIEKKGKEAAQFELVVEYSAAITRSPGQNKVSFQAPQAPVNRWQVKIPQSGVKLNIHPMIAATEVPEAADSADETVMLAFVGAAPVVTIDWTPKTEGAAGMDALASVQAEQQVRINEGVVRTTTQLTYNISRAELPELIIEVPADQKVVNVFDPNVRRWPVTIEGGKQRITAELYEPAKGTQRLTVELEKYAGDQPQGSVDVPVVEAVGVERQQGVVVVKVAEGLRAEATVASGVMQLSAAELSETLKRGTWDFSYRFATVPFKLAFNIEKVKPRLLVDSLVEAYLEPDKISLDMASVYTIQKAGVFRLELDVPEGYDLRHVSGKAIGDAKRVEVLTKHLEGEKKTRLIVNLAEKAIGKVGLLVELEKELDEPDLLTPTGNKVDIPMSIPCVAPDSVERATGRLVVYAPESLQANPGELEGLRSVKFGFALRAIPSIREIKPEDVRPVLAFAYTQEPTKLALSAERRKPQVTIRQLLSARIEDGVVKYEATFFYDVLYSGVKSLRIDVPEELAEKIQNNTPQIRKEVIDPAPEDLAEGYVAWSFASESELLGEGTIDLTWEDEKELKELEVGKSVKLAIPHLKPMEVDRAWGQIVLAKAETIDVHPEGELKNLRPIDPRTDLMDGMEIEDAARAFEFHDDWQLDVTATRYQLEEVKRTCIERAVVRMVITRADQISVQALYRMRSARQRIEIELPEGVEFDTNPLQLNGRRVPLQTEGGKYFVPLVDQEKDEPFLVELRYTFAGDGRELPLPLFPNEPGVQKVYVGVYIPDETVHLGKKDNKQWSDEFYWRISPRYLKWRPFYGYSMRPKEDYDAKGRELVEWVTYGIQLSESPLGSFPTGGRLYVFSTMQPAPPPEGTLRLRTMNENWLHGIVFAVVILGGLLLLPVRLGGRALAIGSAIVAVVLGGVFCPAFTLQLLTGTSALAVFIVLVIWIVAFAMRLSGGKKRAAMPLPQRIETAEERDAEKAEGGESNE